MGCGPSKVANDAEGKPETRKPEAAKSETGKPESSKTEAAAKPEPAVQSEAAPANAIATNVIADANANVSSDNTPKVIVITGASSGIGKAIALALAKEPGAYRLVLAARRKEELEAVVAACGGAEVAISHVTDVTKREDVKSLLSAAAAKWGRIDVLVNNAGVGCVIAPSTLTDDDVDRMMSINVNSAFYGMQEVLPYLEANGGQIVNVSTMLARIPIFPGAELACSNYAAYSAAKAFLTSLTDTFRAELKSKNPKVTVTSFFPGPVDTPFGDNAGAGPSSANPMSQNVDECAAVFVEEVIVKRRENVYSRPSYPEAAAGYLAAAHEK